MSATPVAAPMAAALGGPAGPAVTASAAAPAMPGSAAAGQGASRRPGRRSLYAALLAAAIVAAAWYGHDWYTVGRFMQETDDAYVGGDVTVLGPKVPGYITEVAVKDNQAVHAGDVLVKLDDRDYKAALDKAEGAVAAQQALLANLDANRHLQEAMIEQARATVLATDAEKVRTREDYARYKTLSANAAVSIQRWQQADSDYKTANANSLKAQAALSAAQRQLDVIDTQKQQARAALAQAAADRDIARLNLEYTVIRAPVDGTIGNRRARLGAYAAAGSQLLSVVPATGLWVDANFKESQLAKMTAGQRAIIRADIMPGREFHGRVASVAPATGAQFSVLPPENATGNFTKIVQRVPVRILLDKEDATLGLLRPGLSVVAEVDERDHS